jgi:hypothetical protein
VGQEICAPFSVLNRVAAQRSLTAILRSSVTGVTATLRSSVQGAASFGVSMLPNMGKLEKPGYPYKYWDSRASAVVVC